MPKLQMQLPLNAKIIGVEMDTDRDIPKLVYEHDEKAETDMKHRTLYIERGTPVFQRLLQIATMESSPGVSMVHATDPKRRLRYLGQFECREPHFIGHVFEEIFSE